MQKKILNYRPLVLILISFVVGIFFSLSILSFILFKKVNFGIFALLALVLAFFVTLLLKFKFKNNNVFYNLIFKNTIIVLVVLVISFLCCLISFHSKCFIVNYDKANCKVEGIASSVDSYYTQNYVTFDSFYVVRNNKKIKINTPLKIKIKNCDNNLKKNDLAEFECNLSLDLKNNHNLKILNYIVDAEFSTEVDYSNVRVIKNVSSVGGAIRDKSRQILNDSMSETNAGIAYGVLFGDSSFIEDDVRSNFSHAGISHILAVSGLHVGVLVGLILFLLNRLKMNKYVNLTILILILLFYAYLCNFSPSILRATIMYAVFYSAGVFGEEFDKLNSWCLAGIVILFFSPISLFSISFQLSFVCIFAIFMLSPYIIKILGKLKLGKFLSGSLGVSVAINILTLPLIANYFNNVSLIGVFANILVLPLFTVTYIILFTFLLICLVFPFMAFILKIPEFFIHVLVRISSVLSNIKFLSFSIFKVGYLSIMLLMLALWFQNYIIIKSKFKMIISLSLVMIAIISFVVNIIPRTYYNKNFKLIYSQYKTNSIVLVCNNRVVLLGSVDKSMYLRNSLYSKKINQINDYIATDFELNKIDETLDLMVEYRIKNIYLAKGIIQNSFVQEKFKDYNIIELNSSIDLEGININPIYDNSELLGVKICIDCNNDLFANNLTKKQMLTLLNEVDFDINNLFVYGLNFNIYDYYEINISNIYYIDSVAPQDNTSINTIKYKNYCLNCEKIWSTKI